MVTGGPDNNWDVYSIDLATEFPGFVATQLQGISIGWPDIACTIYFDDIHFE